MEGIRILSAGQEHISKIVALGNAELGEGFLNYQEVLDMALDNDNYVFKVALRDDVIGFCLCKIIPQNKVCDYLHVKRADLPAFVNSATKVGVLKTVAISQVFQKHGVGYALTSAGVNGLAVCGIKVAASIAWKNGERINADRVLTSAGLEPHMEIASYWGEDSVLHQYSCPACGLPPCRCSAVLYFGSI